MANTNRYNQAQRPMHMIGVWPLRWMFQRSFELQAYHYAILLINPFISSTENARIV